MKPTIRFSKGLWVLEYNFRPRSFWLFGLAGAAREEYIQSLVAKSEHTEFAAALRTLADAYRERNVNRF